MASKKAFGRLYYDSFRKPEYLNLEGDKRRTFYKYIYENEHATNSGIYLLYADDIVENTHLDKKFVNLFLAFPKLINDAFIYESGHHLLFYKSHFQNAVRIPGAPAKFIRGLMNEYEAHPNNNLWREWFRINAKFLEKFGAKYFLEKKEDTKTKIDSKRVGRDILEEFLAIGRDLLDNKTLSTLSNPDPDQPNLL